MKKIIAILCLFLLIMQILPVSVMATTDSVDADELRAYLFEGLRNCDTNIDISSFNIPSSSENLQFIYNMIDSQMPECFHVDRITLWSQNDIFIMVEATYLAMKSEYEAMLSELTSTKNELLQGIQGNQNLGDVEKALLIHDRLAMICEYDYNRTAHRFDIYGALVNGTAVCQGYAVAYDYLLEEVGIEGYICASEQLNHAWNIVYIQDTPYHVDVTWDDMSWDTGSRGAAGAVTHDNFLRSSQGIYESGHDSFDYDASPSDTTYDNYFWQTSKTAFELVGNELYYIDNEAEKLKRYSDGAVLCNVASYWPYLDRGYWSNQARLSGDGKNLYYSLADGVFRYNIATGESGKILQPNLDKYTRIYGFAYSNGEFICDISDAPPYSKLRTTLYQIKQTYPALATVEKWNIALSDDINANFQLAIDDSLTATARVKISVDEKTITKPVADLEQVDAMFKVSVDLAAAQMNDRILVQLLDGNREIYASEYTVRRYCLTILDDPTKSEYHSFAKQMLNYGAMAQLYFDHSTNELANTGINIDCAELPETTEEMSVSGAISGIAFYGASLVYRDRIAVRYYFTGDVNGLTFTANGNTYSPVSKDGLHYVEIADILPQNLDQQITLAVTDANGSSLSVTYGPMNYIVRMNRKGDETTQNLMKALYNYHLAAKALSDE